MGCVKHCRCYDAKYKCIIQYTYTYNMLPDTQLDADLLYV